jgi:hypothetical protein
LLSNAVRIRTSAPPPNGERDKKMEDENLRLFRMVALEVVAKVNHACSLAQFCDEPTRAFDILHQVLNKSLDQMCIYEANLKKAMAIMTDVEDFAKKDPPDGN